MESLAKEHSEITKNSDIVEIGKEQEGENTSKIIRKLTTRFLPWRIKYIIRHIMWVVKGRPPNMPHILKANLIRVYQRKTDYKTFIETGTFLGDMVYAQRKKFDEIISIELNDTLYRKAVKRFKKYKHIKIIKGNSGKILKKICKRINKSAIFWLDAHYCTKKTSGKNEKVPIHEELNAIFKNNHNHVMLIDDARLFIGKGGYPAMKDLSKFIKQKDRDYNVEVKNDVIRVTPKNFLK